MVTNLKRYLTVYVRFLKNSFAVDAEYRFSLLFKNITGLVWILGALFTLDVIFSQATSVAGWSRAEISLLYVSFSLSMDFFDLFLRNNFMKFSSLIRAGGLDWLLLRPINSRFLVSFMSGGLETGMAIRLPVGLYMLYHFLPLGTPVANIVLYFVYLALGNFAVYSFIFALHTLNIWFIKLDNITTLSQTTFGFTRLPLDSWPKAVQLFLIYIFPMGLLSNYAVLALLGRSTLAHLLTTVGVCVILFIASQKFWSFALRHYSSASS